MQSKSTMQNGVLTVNLPQDFNFPQGTEDTTPLNGDVQVGSGFVIDTGAKEEEADAVEEVKPAAKKVSTK